MTPHTLTPRKAPRQSRSVAMVDTILQATTRVLVSHGYDGMNTNAVAACAGVSVGSLYQYFPNKAALLAALHRRHAMNMAESIENVLAASRSDGLRESVVALVRAAMAAHEVEPELHRMLEKERAFLDENMGAAGERIHVHIRDLLGRHQAELRHDDLDVAAWMTVKMVEALVHAAVLEPLEGQGVEKIETAIVDGILGFLSR